MPIKAPISELGLFDFLQLISLTSKSGIINLANNNNQKNFKLYFQDGRLEYIDLTDRILNEIIKRELVNKEVLKSLEGNNLIEYIIERKLMNINTFRIFYKQIASEVLYSLFMIDSGQIIFEECEFSIPYSLNLGMKVENIILEAARRIDEISKMEEVIPSRGIILEVSSDIKNMNLIDLNRMEWEIISLIDGKRTIADLVREIGNELEVLKSLYGLIMTGIITEKRIEINNIAEERKKEEDKITKELKSLSKFWRGEEYNKGVEFLSLLKKKYPEDKRIIYELGFYYLATGRFKRAISEWDSYLMLSENENQKKEIRGIINLVMELNKKISSREVSK